MSCHICDITTWNKAHRTFCVREVNLPHQWHADTEKKWQAELNLLREGDNRTRDESIFRQAVKSYWKILFIKVFFLLYLCRRDTFVMGLWDDCSDRLCQCVKTRSICAEHFVCLLVRRFRFLHISSDACTTCHGYIFSMSKQSSCLLSVVILTLSWDKNNPAVLKVFTVLTLMFGDSNRPVGHPKQRVIYVMPHICWSAASVMFH